VRHILISVTDFLGIASCEISAGENSLCGCNDIVDVLYGADFQLAQESEVAMRNVHAQRGCLGALTA
jgi:hypothetical protein